VLFRCQVNFVYDIKLYKVVAQRKPKVLSIAFIHFWA
jgi:hypothetical protein